MARKGSNKHLGSRRGQLRRAFFLIAACVWVRFLFGNARYNANHMSTFITGQSNDASVERTIQLASHQLNELAKVETPHGNFYFGPHSQSVHTPKNEAIQLSWTPEQERLLNDEEIDVERERERCASYKFNLQLEDGKPIKRRRRLFLGSLIAADSIEVIRAVSTEVYNMFHTISFIESNTTQNLTPRKWRFLDDDERPSRNLHELYQLYGPKTKVSVDYYITTRKNGEGGNGLYGLLQERLPKEGITYRWRMNGMRPDDVAIVADTDETFSRDFLRALQICDVPAFRDDQNCQAPKLIGSTTLFESSPECVSSRVWYHPDTVIGACVDLIGNSTLNPTAIREWTKDDEFDNSIKLQSSHGSRKKGHGQMGNYSLANYSIMGNYPLWSAEDIRTQSGGGMIAKADAYRSHTAYHFHNFFASADDIHFKYYTYGHAWGQAMRLPMWKL